MKRPPNVAAGPTLAALENPLYLLRPLAEAMLMAGFVCIRRALYVARKSLETGPA